MVLDNEKQREMLLQVINALPIQECFGNIGKVATESPLAQLKRDVESAEIKKEEK